MSSHIKTIKGELSFGWTYIYTVRSECIPGYAYIYDPQKRSFEVGVVNDPDEIQKTCEEFVWKRIQAATGLSREALEVAIWCSENMDTKQPRVLFDSADFRVVRISGGESAIIFSENGKIADAFLGDMEDGEGPVNDGVISATVAMAAIKDPDVHADVMSKLDEIQAELKEESCTKK